MAKKLIPLAAMEKILREAGAERVSDRAKTAMKEVVEGIATQMAENAVDYAKHAKRVTIKEDDIKKLKLIKF